MAHDLAALKLKLGKQTNASDLDPVPRNLARAGREQPHFNGWDLWNAYEVSFLLPSGLPAVYHMQASYAAHSPNIVESKSFKLFLNARNQRVFADLDQFSDDVRDHLSACVGAPVQLAFYPSESSPAVQILEARSLDHLQPSAIAAHYDPSLLARQPAEGDFAFKSHLLRSNCPVTNQPDWGSVWIQGSGTYQPRAEALLAYLISFRNHQDFHEACCETLFCDLHALLEPERLTVACFYTRRGGLDINPLRTTEDAPELIVAPVWRQ